MVITVVGLVAALVLTAVGCVQAVAPMRLQPLYAFLQWKQEPKKQLDAGVGTRLGGLFDIALAGALAYLVLR